LSGRSNISCLCGMKISTKARLHALYIRFCDFCHHTRFAGTVCSEEPMAYSIEVVQPFLPSSTLDSKKHNLAEAARCINRVVVRPGELFSFWHIVGNPNDTKRFKEGRSIHAGVLSSDVGGGLCQASGIIFHAALLAGMEIVERYNHSVDLYTDDTRYTPLGTDATVFYGFRDLRLRNPFSFNICFQLVVEDNYLCVFLQSEQPIPLQSLTIHVKEDTDGYKHVSVLNAEGKQVSSSCYAPLQ